MNLTGTPSSYCPSCEGSWLDGPVLEGRLGAHPESSALLDRLRDLRRGGLPPGRLDCPRCLSALSTVHVGGTELEFCCSCGGAFYSFEAVRGAGAATTRELTAGEMAALGVGDIVFNSLVVALTW